MATSTAEQSNHGGSIVAKVLASHGIQCIYTLCGGHISPILQACSQQANLRVVDCRDERSAAFAADAYSRRTGKPGVVVVTAGPGVTNTITAVENAQQPVVVLGGATATILRGRGALQDINQISVMKPVTKWCARATKVADVEPLLCEALNTACQGLPGPVFVELPLDILYPEKIVREWYVRESGVERIKGWMGAVVKYAMQTYLWHQFHMPHLTSKLLLVPFRTTTSFRTPTRITNHHDGGRDGQVKKVARALARAERPMLVIGSQAMVNLTPRDASDLASAVNRLGIPTFLAGSARGLLGRHSKIQFRHKRTHAMRETDCIVVAGVPFDFRMGYGQKINKRATVVSVHLSSKAALIKNRRPTHSIRAHPGFFLQKLASIMDKTATKSPSMRCSKWFDTLQQREDARDAEIAKMATQDDNESSLVNPMYLFQCMEEKMGDDAVIIVDGGDFCATAAYMLRPRQPMSWLDPGAFGTLGVGGGFAVGVASSSMMSCKSKSDTSHTATATISARSNGTGETSQDNNDKKPEIWLIYGDGSSAYSLAEFDTYRRHGFCPIAVIGNDASWQQIARDQVSLLGTDVGTVLRRSDYHTVAEGYGGKGLLLKDSSKVKEVLEEAQRLSREEGHAVCINVHLAKSNFREGSVSI